MAARSASRSRSSPLRFFLKNVNCTLWEFYSRDHFQTRAPRSQTVASAWERGLWSAGHALRYMRRMAVILEGLFWVPGAGFHGAGKTSVRGRKKTKSSDARRRWSRRPYAGAGMLHACKLRAVDILAVRFSRVGARGACFTFILLSTRTTVFLC